jgi:hypothetical protein
MQRAKGLHQGPLPPQELREGAFLPGQVLPQDRLFPEEVPPLRELLKTQTIRSPDLPNRGPASVSLPYGRIPDLWAVSA